MSFRDREPDDWFRRFFGSSSNSANSDILREFIDSIGREMKRMFEQQQFQDIQSKAPKELVREYETPKGDMVREIGPIVYGYSVNIGPDGKPKIREFGNIRPSGRNKMFGGTSNSIDADDDEEPQITAEREPIVDVLTTDKEVKVIVEVPGINKENIKVNAYDTSVEISAIDAAESKRYHRLVDLPSETDTSSTAKATYKNGILEITFNKNMPHRGKDINVQ
ncbi:MAG TPA: Hsp20/alpha crystallin family protein [Nitrososphaeraceae archaeon]|nr:Hsp20/alpha crystallin family protein [Nitrososphaeraceae archaeon]